MLNSAKLLLIALTAIIKCNSHVFITTITGLKCIRYWKRLQLNLIFIDQSQPEMDLASLMTKVAELVSEQRSPGVGQDGQELTKLQIPCIVSTLKKQIFLPREWRFFYF